MKKDEDCGKDPSSSWNDTTSRTRPCENHMEVERSEDCISQQDDSDITSQMSPSTSASTPISIETSANVSCTPVSRPPSKKRILNDKSVISSDCTPSTTSSSATSPAASSLKQKVLQKFWNPFVNHWSQNLWLATKVGLRALEMHEWNMSLRRLAVHSWFTVKTKRIKATSMMTMSLQSSRFLLQAINAKELQRTAKESEKKAIEKKKRQQKIELAYEARMKRGRSKEETQKLDELQSKLKDELEIQQKWRDESTQVRGRIKSIQSRIKFLNSKSKRTEKITPEAREEELETLEKELKELEERKSNIPNMKKINGGILQLKSDIKQEESLFTAPIFKELKAKQEVRARKYKVNPTCKDRIQLQNWMHTTRGIYNKCVEFSQKHGDFFILKPKMMVRVLRNHIFDVVLKRHPKFVLTPQSLRDAAIMEFVNAVNANKAKAKKAREEGKDFHFEMRFRSFDKMQRQTLKIESRLYNRKSGEFAFLKDLNKHRYHKFKKDGRRFTKNVCLPNSTNHEVQITRSRIGHYHMIVLVDVDEEMKKKHRVPEEERHDVIALDPGERTFHTGYGTNGEVIEWGSGDIKRIEQLLVYADELQSQMDKAKPARKKRMKRAWLWKFQRIRNKIHDCHHKLALWLCKHYKIILIPKFETSKMTTRENRLSSKISRRMLTWRHYSFRQILLAKAQLFDCKVFECDEHWTTKTCSCCGDTYNPGRSKTYHCASCGYVADRDVNGARNILLRFIRIYLSGVRPEAPLVTTHNRESMTAPDLQTSPNSRTFGF